jgi:hypothetical protein
MYISDQGYLYAAGSRFTTEDIGWVKLEYSDIIQNFKKVEIKNTLKN